MPPSSPFPPAGDAGPARTRPAVVGGRGRNALIWRWWNLLLILPLLMLVTPWFNKDRPRLGGLPFFYWYQLAFVFIGVACVAIVYAATKTPSSTTLPPPVPVSADDNGTTTEGRDR
jgi:hypothetical protein